MKPTIRLTVMRMAIVKHTATVAVELLSLSLFSLWVWSWLLPWSSSLHLLTPFTGIVMLLESSWTESVLPGFFNVKVTSPLITPPWCLILFSFCFPLVMMHGLNGSIGSIMLTVILSLFKHILSLKGARKNQELLKYIFLDCSSSQQIPGIEDKLSVLLYGSGMDLLWYRQQFGLLMPNELFFRHHPNQRWLFDLDCTGDRTPCDSNIPRYG